MDFMNLLADAGMITPSSDVSRPSLPRGEERSAAIAPCSSHGEDTGSRRTPDEGGTYVIGMERADDVAAREALLDRAMGPGRRRKSSEKLRRGRRPSEGLDLVAKDGDGTLVGTVRLWDVRAGEGGPAALLLGPLAVDPAVKSAGIGSALMRHAIGEAARLGHSAILLVGDAAYYSRFGFSSEKTGKLAMPGPYERERFLALELVEGVLDGASGVLKASGRKAKPAPMARAA